MVGARSMRGHAAVTRILCYLERFDSVASTMRWILKAIAGRWPSAALFATGARWVALFAFGHPVVLLAALAAILVDARSLPGIAGVALVGIAGEWLLSRSLPAFKVWQFTLWFWRTWPIRWAEVAGKTGAVQAVTGGENQQRAASRPVLDAPTIWPRSLTGSGCLFRCGPPPGRTFSQLAEVAEQLAASDRRIVSVEVDYRSSSASSGLLFAALADPLVNVGEPAW